MSDGGLYYDTNRQVPIGITVQPNNSSTKGSNLSLMLETGYNFTSPLGAIATAMPVEYKASRAALNVTHGPVVGITLQRVRVDGFTETDQFAAAGGFTALSFAGQTRNSAVSELGYKASMDVGIWQPFTKLVWNHELANTDRLVSVRILPIQPERVPWTMPISHRQDQISGLRAIRPRSVASTSCLHCREGAVYCCAARATLRRY